MELKTLKCFLRAIQLLKEGFGQKLFQREKYSVRLTAAGLALFHDAEEMLLLAHKVESKFKTRGNIYGDIYIGCAESQAMKYFARAAKNVLERNPNIRFNLYSDNIEDVTYKTCR